MSDALGAETSVSATTHRIIPSYPGLDRIPVNPFLAHHPLYSRVSSCKYHIGGKTVFDAVNDGNLLLLHALHIHGEKMDAMDPEGRALIHHACIAGNMPVIQYLLQNPPEGKSSAEIVSMETRDELGQTPLLFAAMRGNAKLFLYLKEHYGLDIHQKDKAGRNSVIYAAMYGHTETVHILRSLGVDCRLRDSDGRLAWEWAANQGHLDTVKYFVDEASISASEIASSRDDKQRTLLHWAALKGYTELASYLLNEIGTDADVRDINGHTAEMLARSKGFGGIANELKRSVIARSTGRYNVYGVLCRLFRRYMPHFWACFRILLITWTFYLDAYYLSSYWWIHLVHCGLMGRNLYLSLKAVDLEQGTGLLESCKYVFVAYWWAIFSTMAVAFYGGPSYILSHQSPFLHALLWVMIAATMLVQPFLSLSDPGILSLSASTREEFYRHTVESQGEIDEDLYCKTCKLKKPLRSKHCRTTGRCIAKFDHFCGWLGVAIGFRNYRLFMGFLTLMVFDLLAALYAFCAYYFAMFEAFQLSHGYSCAFPLAFLRFAFTEEPLYTYLIVHTLFAFLMVAYMMYYNILCVATNTTANERINYERYIGKHFIKTRKGIVGAYDLGFVRNIREFFGFGVQRNWMQMYPSKSLSMNQQAEQIQRMAQMQMQQMFGKAFASHPHQCNDPTCSSTSTCSTAPTTANSSTVSGMAVTSNSTGNSTGSGPTPGNDGDVIVDIRSGAAQTKARMRVASGENSSSSGGNNVEEDVQQPLLGGRKE